jgi:hypothetical protein
VVQQRKCGGWSWRACQYRYLPRSNEEHYESTSLWFQYYLRSRDWRGCVSFPDIYGHPDSYAMSTYAMNKYARLLAYAAKVVLGGVGMLLVAAWFWVSSATSGAPTVPRPETGNVVPFNNHGKTVYVTQFEDRFVVWCPAAIALVILAGALSKKWIASVEKR